MPTSRENVLIVFSVILVFLMFSVSEKIDVIYFTDESCRAAIETNDIIFEINSTLGKYIELKIYDINSNETDAQALKQKYKIYGVPFIIINGKPLKKTYTEENIREAICKEFFIPPVECG